MSSDSPNVEQIKFMKRMSSLPQDVRSMVLRHGKHSDVHGSESSKREMALMVLESLKEKKGEGEDLKFARNQIKQIDSAWIDSLKEYNQTDCKEYKDFEKTLTSDTIRHALRHHYLNPSPEKVSEKKKSMLREKELEIVMRNVKKLKLFMHKYQDDPDLVEKIRHKLGSITRDYYRRGGPFDFNEGAHPEYIMNSFIYNPWKDETRFKVLRIDGNQVTYQPYRNDRPDGNVRTIGLDEFLKITISAQTHGGFWRNIPIGEVYRFFPDRDDEFDTDESYNAKVDYYLEHLMGTFAKKPDTEFFSVPYVPPAKASGGRKTHHKRHNKKKKRTYKRRK